MHKKIYLLACALVALIIIGALRLARSPHTEHPDTLHIVCTTTMIADAVATIAGTRARITTLMGPGVDPHLYRAREGDVHRLASADIIFYNGLHLEGKMVHVLKAMNRYTCSVAVTDTLEKNNLLQSQDYPDVHDPHIWFDVRLWQTVATHIHATLVAHDPHYAHIYDKNLHRYHNELTQLHEYIARQAHTLPEKKRILVTAHDAFGYFGAAYGFRVVGLQGISTETEAGTYDVQHLVDFIVTNKVRALFVESSVPIRNIQAVQIACSVRNWPIAIGPELYSDALGHRGSGADTYSAMMRYTIDTLVTALR